LSPILLLQEAVVASAKGQERPKSTPDHSERATGGSFLNLTIRLRDDGTSEILRATQVDGRLIERKLPATNYVYEIVKDGKPFAVGFLPEGSFAWRGFKPLDGGTEKTGKAKSATITLNIPDTDLDSAKLGKIGLRIYEIHPGIELDTINLAVLKKLLADQKAAIQFELPSAAVAAQTKEVRRAPAEGPK
jgi:hypothetical protein